MQATPARRLRDALEPIAAQGFSSPFVRGRLRELGLRGVEGYVWGRATALGEPSAGVVVATFGVFAPPLLTVPYEAARAKASRAEVLDARAAGAGEGLAAALDDAGEAGRVAGLLLEATSHLDATARPLFAGLRDLPQPADPYGRLWRAADLVREHRGDSHLAACIAAGLDPIEMNVLTELAVGYPLGEYSSTRGHTAAAIDEAAGRLAARGWLEEGMLTPAGRARREAIEAATDEAQAGMVLALGDALEGVIDSAATMAGAVIAAGSFTSDARKRAAG